MATDRMPPQNTDAERAVIGGILRDPTVFDLIAADLRAADFYTDAHQSLYTALHGLFSEGKPIDLVSTLDAIQRAGNANSVGGPQYLAELYDANPHAANVEYHAGLIREAALTRRVIHATNETLRDAYDRIAPADELLATAERRLFDLRTHDGGAGPVIARTLIRDAFARIDQRKEAGGGFNGLATGFPDLDAFLAGLKPGQLVILGARPGGGKTALALNVAANAAGAGAPALFFSMEMTKEEIGDRLLSMRSDVSLTRINRADLKPEHIEAITRQQHGDGAGTLRLWVDDTPNQPADRLAAVTRRAVTRHGVRLAVVDYLQLMKPDNTRANRNEQVGGMARRLKLLARECGIPVLCLCQLSRAVESRADPRPVLSDLRESGEIEQHADAVVFLSPAPQQSNEWEVWTIDVGVRKNRNGPTGDLQLCYRRPVLRFENYRPMGD